MDFCLFQEIYAKTASKKVVNKSLKKFKKFNTNSRNVEEQLFQQRQNTKYRINYDRYYVCNDLESSFDEKYINVKYQDVFMRKHS